MVSGRRWKPRFSPKPNYYFLAHLAYNVPSNLQTNLFHYICKLTSKRCAKTFIFLCTGNKDFAKYLAQGGGLTPTPLPYALETIGQVSLTLVIMVTHSLILFPFTKENSPTPSKSRTYCNINSHTLWWNVSPTAVRSLTRQIIQSEKFLPPEWELALSVKKLTSTSPPQSTCGCQDLTCLSCAMWSRGGAGPMERIFSNWRRT